MGIALVFQIIKRIATKIPWTQVAQNAPLIADMVGKAKDKLNASARKIQDDQIQLLQEENARLAKSLLQMSDQLQNISSRVYLLTVITAVSLLIAISSLIIGVLH
ncbi:MAG TPA: hypothetical protein VIK40_10120 [Geomonas sp.]